MSALEELMAKLADMPAESRAAFEKHIAERTSSLTWFPNPGPQTDAYFSEADITLYGGQAGGGKTNLSLGLAIQKHYRAIIFRREASQTDGLEAEGKKIIADSASYNGVDMEWSWLDGKSLKLAGMKEPDDWMKHAGRERDLIVYDEAGEFLESQVRSSIAWNRGPEGQKCRILLGSNPPRTSEGLWMLIWFAPWLDPKFHNPAVPGELRWIIFKGDKLIWVDGPGMTEIEGEQYTHLSITFIPASLEDNPYRNNASYRAKLQSLPEPLRSQLLHGNFTAGVKDNEFQVIPTDWIMAAQARWTPTPPEGFAMTAIAKDPKGGGEDKGESIYRYGGWFGKPMTSMIDDSKDGSASAAEIIQHRRDDCGIVVDVGGGYGGQIVLRLEDNGCKEKIIAFNGAKKSLEKTKDGQLAFANKRSEAYWRFREALDPDQEGGSAVALPPDPELRADLATPTWTLTAQGIQVEPKEVYKEGKLVGGIKKRIGRSPGKGDVAVMCLSEGDAAVRRKYSSQNRPKTILGHEAKRRSQ